jgi:hypothetical protein
MPMQRASSALDGWRRIWPLGQSTIGSSASSTENRSISTLAQSTSGIEVPIRVAVAGQEARQADDHGVGGAADDHRASGARFQQPDAAQDQGAHDPLAQLGLGDQHGAQAVGLDAQHLQVGQGVDVDQGRSVRQLGQFADEVAGTVLDDHVALVMGVAAGDLGLAFEDHHQSGRDLAGLGQHGAGPGVGDVAEAADAVDLLRLQGGEHLIAAGVDDGHDPRVLQDSRRVILQPRRT